MVTYRRQYLRARQHEIIRVRFTGGRSPQKEAAKLKRSVLIGMYTIILSVIVALRVIVCFYYYNIMGITEILSGSQEIVTTVGKAGASSHQIWQVLSFLAFVVGLGLITFK